MTPSKMALRPRVSRRRVGFSAMPMKYRSAGDVASSCRAALPGSVHREIALDGLSHLSPQDPDPQDVAKAIARVVDMPFGQRPLRIHFDPDEDGAAVVDGVADRARAELLRRIGLADLLKPAVIK